MIFFVKCYNNSKVVRSETCMDIMEAEIKATELIELEFYDEVKIIEQENQDA